MDSTLGLGAGCRTRACSKHRPDCHHRILGSTSISHQLLAGPHFQLQAHGTTESLRPSYSDSEPRPLRNQRPHFGIMTLPIAALNEQEVDRLLEASRATKRQKVADAPSESPDSSLVRRHPLGVRPSGNALTSIVNVKQAHGHFAALPDDLLMQLLESLEARDLLRLGGTCRGLHAFTRSEELWRALFVE